MDTPQWNAGSLIELSGMYWKTCSLHAAVKLDVFSAIGDNRLTAEELAASLGCSLRGMEMLLNAVAAMGLLVKEDEAFANRPSVRPYLSRDGDHYIGSMILHHRQLVPSWASLDRSVQTGKPARERASSGEEEWRENFLMGMFNTAMQIAPRLVPAIDLDGRRNLLDLGGGPGTYAVHFCRHNPGLSATVFDLPTSRPFAEKVILDFGLSHRISFKEGNFLEDDLGTGYDAAWLSHILHAEGPEDCCRILSRVVEALHPGGAILVHEFILDNDMAGPIFPALFSLNMLLGTPGGRSYSERQLGEMLHGAGVKDIRRIPFEGPTRSGVLAGTL